MTSELGQARSFADGDVIDLLVAQAEDQRRDHQEHEAEDREPHDGDDLLQGGQAGVAREDDQHRGHQPFGHAPEDALASRSGVWRAGAEHVDHQRSRVRGRGEENRDHEHGDTLYEVGEGEVFEEGEHGERHGFGHRIAERAGLVPQGIARGGADAVDLHRLPAENREPDQGKERRGQQHAEDEFADRAPARDARDEKADEGGPRHCPCPVEHGPAALPAPAVGIGADIGQHVVPEREARQVAEVEPDGFDHAAQQKEGRAADQHEDHEAHGHADVDVGQKLDALVEAGDDGHHSHGCQDREDRDLEHDAGVPAKERGKSGGDLGRAETERDRDPEERAENRRDVDGFAQWTVDPVLDQRVENGTDAHGQVVAVDEIGEGEPRQGEDRPGVQGEVIGCDGNRVLRGLFGIGLDPRQGRGGEMAHGFGHAPEHQDGADAAGKQHREPRQVCVVGAGVAGAEADMAVTAHGGPNEETEPEVDAEDEEPAQVRNDPRAPGGEGVADGFRRDDQCKNEDDGEDGGYRENHRIGFQAHPFNPRSHMTVPLWTFFVLRR